MSLWLLMLSCTIWCRREQCRELGLLHRAAGSCVNPWVPSPPSETPPLNKRSAFAQENPARVELEPHLCHRRDSLCNSLPNSPRLLKSASLLSGCQPVPALPSPSPASSPGGHAAQVTPSWGTAGRIPLSSPMAGRAAQPQRGTGFVPPSFQHSPSNKHTKLLVGIKHQLKLAGGGTKHPSCDSHICPTV